MYHKLLLDHAGEWYRAAKSIQEDQIHVKDQIYSNRSWTDMVHEQPVNRTRESWVSHPSYSRYCVKENSLEIISPDPVQSTLPTLDTHPEASPFDSKSEDREEITGTSAPPEIPKEQGTYTQGSKKVNKKALWEASQFI